MKKFTKNLNLMFMLAFLCSISLSMYAQNKSDNVNILDPNSIFIMEYMQIHDQYKMKLDPINYVNNDINRNADDNYLLFLMDVAVVYSVFADPKRYIYTYTDDNYLDNILIQEQHNSNWDVMSIQSFTYDTSGNMLASELRVWDGSNLANVSRNTFTYNINNNVETFINELWLNNTWTNSDMGTYTYNSSDLVLSFLTEKWENGDWENNTNELYTYDNNGYMLTAEGSIWTGNGWANDNRHNYSYDSEGNLITGLSEIYVGDTAWSNLYQETYTYNTTNKRLTFIGENWEQNSWVYDLSYQYSYDGQGLLSNSVLKSWENNEWINQVQEDYYYNDFGGFETVFTQVWEADEWVNSTNSINTYDQYGNTTKGQFFDWLDGNWEHTYDGVINAYYNYSLDVNYFTGYLADMSYLSIVVGDEEIQYSRNNNFSCMPNPVSSNSILSIIINNDTDADIGIYDLKGKKVQSIYNGNLQKGKHSFSISATSLPAGIYIAKISSDIISESIKIII